MIYLLQIFKVLSPIIGEATYSTQFLVINSHY
jgi:hypothetical protein